MCSLSQIGELFTVLQSVPQITVQNMTTKGNPGTLPINLYAVGPPDVQPLDLTKLGDHHSVQHMPQSNQVVCVKVIPQE